MLAERLQTLEKFQNSGFIVIENFLESEELVSLEATVSLVYQGWDKYKDAVRKEIFSPESEGVDKEVKEINWPQKTWKILTAEPAFTKIVTFVESLFQQRYLLIHVNSLLKPGSQGSSIAPHQDTGYNISELNNPVTVWIPFASPTTENGTVFYYPGSHEIGPLVHQVKNRVHWVETETIVDADLPNPEPVLGDQGLISVHDSRILHGSFPNRLAQDRLALSLRFQTLPFDLIDLEEKADGMKTI